MLRGIGMKREAGSLQEPALRKRCDVSEDCIGGLGCSAGLCIPTYALLHTSRIRVGDNAGAPGSNFGEHSLRMVFRFHHRRGVVSGAGTQAGREAGWGRV